MPKNKPYNTLTDTERHMYNYDRRQYRNKQQEFERKSVISCSKLGFNDIDDLTESVLDRLNPQTTQNHNHRPNLFDDKHLIGKIRHIPLPDKGVLSE